MAGISPYADGNSVINNGKVYLYYGGSSSTMDNKADLVISGSEAGDNLGFLVSPAGDVNGDGFDDVLVGANLADGNGTDRGRVYLYLGGDPPDNNADFTFTGVKEEGWLGYSVYKRVPEGP